MVNEVSKIIYNTLVVHRAVTLPGVGTLFVVQRSATIHNKREVAAPHFAIDFSSREYGISLVAAISSVANIPTKDAEEIYARWLDKVKDGNKLSICNIGTLNNKTFIADKSLLTQLNPDSSRVVRLPKRGRKWLCALVIIILAAIAAAATIFVIKPGSKEGHDRVAEEHYIPTQTVETAANREIIEENITTPETEIIPEIENVEDTNICDAEIASEEIPAVELWSDNPDIRHWVVAGSYSTETNANRAVDKIRKLHPDICCEQFKLGKMFAVAVFGSTTIDECEEFVRAEKKRLGALWIHTPKRFK